MSLIRRILSRRTLAALGAALPASLGVLADASPAHAISHTEATSQLQAAGIPWTSTGGCNDQELSICTSFERIRPAVIAGIITFQQASGCAVAITGATETGHPGLGYSHSNGYKVDIRLSACVQDYIAANYTYLGYIAGFGHQYESPAGNLYTRESSHWDILYYTCGC
ncbi:hypothetical protein GCM10027280_51090 [Micromonospora polyrhachis]|uniref:Uncharacterized protein n=1 Tax=Micromonospora polyrhachis TaxID=1282883 RepID=A0A7W7WSL5_9ACTN|nr:hypothetical protein [Micromonospora polyrhachis]MBB4961533.1 hypothetical protein [Micromonospora polyrhachis]